MLYKFVLSNVKSLSNGNCSHCQTYEAKRNCLCKLCQKSPIKSQMEYDIKNLSRCCTNFKTDPKMSLVDKIQDEFYCGRPITEFQSLAHNRSTNRRRALSINSRKVAGWAFCFTISNWGPKLWIVWVRYIFNNSVVILEVFDLSSWFIFWLSTRFIIYLSNL